MWDADEYGEEIAMERIDEFLENKIVFGKSLEPLLWLPCYVVWKIVFLAFVIVVIPTRIAYTPIYHFHKRNKDISYFCQDCKKYATTKYSNRKKFKCNFCEKLFDTKDSTWH